MPLLLDRFRLHDTGNRLDEDLPARRLGAELSPTGRCEPVVPELALALFVQFPLRRDQALSLEAMKGRVERSVLETQDIPGGVVDVPRNVVPVPRSTLQGAENQHVERALNEYALFLGSLCHGRVSTLE